MSKSWIKGLKKAKQEAAPAPRDIKAIQQEYTELCSKLGHATYQVNFNKKVVDLITSRLEDLDREGTARKQLDFAAAEAKAKEEQPTSGAV
jgi:hypothetical protein